jgi:hypothetical protein
VPSTAQLTAAAVQCKYEQLDVRRSFPAAFAANMRLVFIAHGAASRQHDDSVAVAASLRWPSNSSIILISPQPGIERSWQLPLPLSSWARDFGKAAKAI